MKSKIETRSRKDLRANTYVRTEINQEHVLHLAELIEHGVKLPPIQINKDGDIIDGRHRNEAYFLNDIDQVEVEVFDIDDTVALIVKAYLCNVGGALPPRPKDTEHVVMQLLELGETKKRIGELLQLPTGLARKYVNNVESRMKRTKLIRAADDLADSKRMTIEEAAETHKVDADDLQQMLKNRRTKKKASAEIQGIMSKMFKSLGMKIANNFRNVLDEYQDGDIPEKKVREIFKHLEHLQKRSARTASEWENRFDAMSKPQKKNGKE